MPTKSLGGPAKRYDTVLLDRDGVINRMRLDYVKRWEEMELLPEALDVISKLTKSGRDVIVLTNQSVIGRGVVAMEAVQKMHERLADLAYAHGGRIKAFLVCPHSPEQVCSCRKPAPGLFFRAERELNVQLPNAIMIGDQLSDIQAAKAAGCDAILVDSRHQLSVPHDLHCIVVSSLGEAARVICET